MGVGHLTASLRIIEELLSHSDVDLVQGGLDTGHRTDHPGLRILRLPTLLIATGNGELAAPGGQPAEAIWPARAAAIQSFLSGPYHAIITEFYPFGRRRFKTEIRQLIAAVRASSGPVPLFCCVREVLVPGTAEADARIAQDISEHFATVFVRGDPDIIRLEATFSYADRIAGKLCYTGYVSAPVRELRAGRERRVLISQGGGDVGRELLLAAIAVAPRFPDFEFLLAAGAQTAPEYLTALQARAGSNVRVVPFLQDFQHQLAASALSISMGGDNTLLDVISTRTPALAYPFQGNPEQHVRIGALAAKGYLHYLAPPDLEADRLAAKMHLALRAPYPELVPRTDGARTTSERIHAFLADSA